MTMSVCPTRLVIDTPKLPDAETVIDCVNAPVDQVYEYPAGAVRVTLPPWQNVVGPEAVICGTGGAFLCGWREDFTEGA